MFSKELFTKILLFSFLILFTCAFFSCKNKNDKIPTVYVDINIDLTDPQYNKLLGVGNYVYITGGVNGIIVYRKSFDEFSAFEQTCPYDPDCGTVWVVENEIVAKDTVCCNSEFSLLIDGAVSEGPAQLPLRNYRTSYNSNTRILRITN